MPDQEQDQAKGLNLNPSGHQPAEGDLPPTPPPSGPARPAAPTTDPSTGGTRPATTINTAPVPAGKVRLAVPYPHDEFIADPDNDALPVVTAFGIDVDPGQVDTLKSAAETAGLTLTEVRS